MAVNRDEDYDSCSWSINDGILQAVDNGGTVAKRRKFLVEVVGSTSEMTIITFILMCVSSVADMRVQFRFTKMPFPLFTKEREKERV